ncbi:MAG: hypothetical protein IJR82_03970 [Bacilli bacterium]|nr:hypothetical protein [Bacilli bacterium]
MSKSNAATVNNYTDGVTTEAYTFEHGATAQTPALTDYRYIGASPNNYVEFNCDDNGENCEVWRAIGVFYVDDGDGNWEWRVKLVRGTSLSTKMSWDTRTSEMYPNDNCGKNEWNGSSIQTYLNDDGEYYARSGSASEYGLKATAKTLISDAKYYLGGRAWISGNQPYGSTDEMYSWERGLETFSYESFCLYNIYHSTWRNRCSSENYCENNPTDEICGATRTLNWKGEIALMYPSDMYMTYANVVDTICYDDPYECTNMHPPYYGVENPGIPTTSWLYLTNENDWFLSPEIQSSTGVFYLHGGGNSNYSVLGSASGGNQGIRPVLYLSSSVKTTSGDGSVDSPYKLSL